MLRIAELLTITKGKLIGVKNNCAIEGFSIDSRAIKKGEVFIAIKGNNFDGHSFIEEAIRRGAGCIIRRRASVPVPSPQSPVPSKVVCIEVKDTIKALGDIACFLREESGMPIVAVTGSNGKTTTKEMIAWVLSAQFKVLKNEGTKNNHIGLPLTLLKADSSFDIGVLELGTNHFKEIEGLAKICLPNIGVITNIQTAHLEHFGSVRGVFNEKYALMKNLFSPCIGILNNDDALLRAVIARKNKQPAIFSFGAEFKSDFMAGNISCKAGKTEFVSGKQRFVLNTWGEYNIYNALAAISVARIFGVPMPRIANRLKSFEFLPNRLKVKKIKQVTFIDDTYNANPASFRAALKVLAKIGSKGRKIVVMGDMLELGQDKEALHAEIGCLAASVCDIFIAVGELARHAASGARRRGKGGPRVFSCESTAGAKKILSDIISLNKHDLVLVKGSRAMKMEEVI